MSKEFSIFPFGMKLLLAIALLALMGCASNKPVAEKPVDKCEILRNNFGIEGMEEGAKMPTFLIDASGQYCPCHETITCNGNEYCYAVKCPDGSIR
jgi:hypothetical protein